MESSAIPFGGPWLLAIGLMMAILPAIPTAASPYHQGYLTFGVGWIGVMIQYYGMALILAVSIRMASASAILGGPFARWKCLVASGLVAALLGLTYRTNQDVAAKINATPGSEDHRLIAGLHGASWHSYRLNVEAALRSGLMDEVPGRAVLQMVNVYPYWHDATFGKYFYATQTGKVIETMPTADPSSGARLTPLVQAPRRLPSSQCWAGRALRRRSWRGRASAVCPPSGTSRRGPDARRSDRGRGSLDSSRTSTAPDRPRPPAGPIGPRLGLVLPRSGRGTDRTRLDPAHRRPGSGRREASRRRSHR